MASSNDRSSGSDRWNELGSYVTEVGAHSTTPTMEFIFGQTAFLRVQLDNCNVRDCPFLPCWLNMRRILDMFRCCNKSVCHYSVGVTVHTVSDLSCSSNAYQFLNSTGSCPQSNAYRAKMRFPVAAATLLLAAVAVRQAQAQCNPTPCGVNTDCSVCIPYSCLFIVY